MEIDEKKVKDFSGGFKRSTGSKVGLGVAGIAIVVALILGFTGDGDTNVEDLISGDSNGEEGIQDIVSDILPGEEATGLFTGIDTLNCEEDSYNCADFETQPEAQQVFDLCGGDDNDVHDLDRDDDLIACDGLPKGAQTE